MIKLSLNPSWALSLNSKRDSHDGGSKPPPYDGDLVPFELGLH